MMTTDERTHHALEPDGGPVIAALAVVSALLLAVFALGVLVGWAAL